MAKQSRSKKAPRKARAAKTSPVKAPRKAAGKPAKAPKAARKAKPAPKAREPRKAAPRAAKAPRARKVRPPKPVEVYGHDAPYNCDDPFVKEPVRLRVCRPDPRKPTRRKCDVREFVVEGCATPGPGRRAKQMYVVPHTHQYLAPAREVARARVMPLPDNGDCADARFAHAHGRSIAEGAYGACNISESSEAGLTVDPASISFPNGYGRARSQMARGSRHNPPLLVAGRNYRWASPHGGSGVVTYLSGDGRTARVSLNGSVFGVPVRELLPLGADIGVGYPMTFPNGADAVGMGTSPTFLPPPKSDPHIGKRVFGKNVQGMVRGVARCGEKGPRQYVVGGQIVSRARVANSLRREKLMAEGNWPPPRRARSTPQVVQVAPAPRRERAPEVMGPAWSPPPPRIMLPPPERIIEAQVVEDRPSAGRLKALLDGYHRGDADSVKEVYRLAQDLVPGIRLKDSDAVVSEVAYGGGITPEFVERMRREGRVLAPSAPRGKAKQTTMALAPRSPAPMPREPSGSDPSLDTGGLYGEVRGAIEMFMGRVPPDGTVRALADAISTGNYNDVVAPGNKNSRAAFEYLTGVKLPKAQGATQDVFRGRPFRLLATSGTPITPPPPMVAMPAGDTYSTGYIGGGRYSISAPREWLDRLIAAMPRKFPSPRISKNPNGPNDTLSTGSEATMKAAAAWLTSMGLGRG